MSIYVNVRALRYLYYQMDCSLYNSVPKLRYSSIQRWDVRILHHAVNSLNSCMFLLPIANFWVKVIIPN